MLVSDPVNPYTNQNQFGGVLILVLVDVGLGRGGARPRPVQGGS